MIAKLGLMAAMWLALLQAPQTGVGGLAADFRLKNFKGEDVSLQQFRGKVVLLDFWATWSRPARNSLPKIARLSRKYTDAGLVLLAVNIDRQPTNAAKFLKQEGVEVTPLWDSRKKVVRAYEVRKMPTSYLIDRAGIVRYITEGFAETDLERLEQRIQRLLRNPPPQQIAQP